MYPNNAPPTYMYQMVYRPNVYQPMIYHVAQPPPAPLPKIPELHIDLPKFEYQTEKTKIIPLDKSKCNNGKFKTVQEAMSFLYKHCYKHHGNFTRNLAKMYAPFCQVLSLVDGGYIQLSLVDKKTFNQSFTKVYRKGN